MAEKDEKKLGELEQAEEKATKKPRAEFKKVISSDLHGEPTALPDNLGSSCPKQNECLGGLSPLFFSCL